MSDPPNLRAALAYAQRGWQVFPCFEPAGDRCACGHADCSSPAKHPRVARGLNAASAEPAQLRTWWSRWPGANVAIRTGAASGLVVIDVDPRHGGSRSLSDLLAERGPLPEGPVVSTGGGGVHIFFAHPGSAVSNDAGRRLGPGLDVRGDGGYVLAPPSLHISARPYEWLEWRAPAPELPDWLQRTLERPVPTVDSWNERHAPARVAGPIKRSAEPWARAALEAEARAVASAPEGERNSTLNRAAFRIGQLVSGVGLQRYDATATLISAARRAGLGDREAERTVASGLEAGEALPRVPALRLDRDRPAATRSAEIGGP